MQFFHEQGRVGCFLIHREAIAVFVHRCFRGFVCCDSCHFLVLVRMSVICKFFRKSDVTLFIDKIKVFGSGSFEFLFQVI